MHTTRLLEQLRQHQDSVLSIMDEAEPMLRDPAQRDVAGLARARWAMVRALATYQLFKHNQVFDPVVQGRLVGQGERAARMKQACIAVGDEFRGYVGKWSGTDVGGAWETYQPAALAMIARLRTHVARERAEIAILLRQAA